MQKITTFADRSKQIASKIDWSKVNEADANKYRRGLIWAQEVVVNNPGCVSRYWFVMAYKNLYGKVPSAALV